MIIKHQCLSHTLSLIVAAPNPNWVNITPVTLWLRVHKRITVYF
uniref:Dtdp-glucose 4-6-dehydratase n=1 Tax=Rhizophora mucronata TaxID=61149 RepID=A0A2P2JYF9_RHIMU